MKAGHTNRTDDMRKVTLSLEDTINDLSEKEASLRVDLKQLASNVKRAQASSATSKVKQLLLSSAAKRKNLTMTIRKRIALEQQLDTIATTQLNQQVLSSMKQTSHALKELGGSLNTADEVMADMQEATDDISELTQTLGSSLTMDSFDDDALNAELSLLMGDEVDGIVEPPKTVNTLNTTKVAVNGEAVETPNMKEQAMTEPAMREQDPVQDVQSTKLKEVELEVNA
ncbi:MAG: Snf7 family protein [Promethearchaeia archaeon]